MPLETANAWDTIIQQSPLIAFMMLVIYAGAQYIKSQLTQSEKRETERETRYNVLVDKLINTKTEETANLIAIITANTEVMRRVEHKLDKR